LLGDVLARALFQSGRFTATDTRFTWAILGGSALGLLPSTLGRLYSSTYYALHDTRTPLRFAMVHVGLATVLGYIFAIPLPRLLGMDARWGAAGLTASAGIAAWAEYELLRSRLGRRIGRTALPLRFAGVLWVVALVSGAAAFLLKQQVNGLSRFVFAAIVLGAFGVLYLGITLALGIPEARVLAARVQRLRR
jgi:putative peptidoglycan lipid II flippase